MSKPDMNRALTVLADLLARIDAASGAGIMGADEHGALVAEFCPKPARNPDVKRIRLYAARNGGFEKGGVLGDCILTAKGWRFMPNVTGRKPSAKCWPSWEQAIPRWTGHPDRTISEAAGGCRAFASLDDAREHFLSDGK